MVVAFPFFSFFFPSKENPVPAIPFLFHILYTSFPAALFSKLSPTTLPLYPWGKKRSCISTMDSPCFYNTMGVIRIPKTIDEMPGASKMFQLGSCFYGCRDHTHAAGLGTRIWNQSDRPVELQIRVGSILKKGHVLKPGASKRLKCKSIYKAHMPGRNGGGGMNSLLYYYDETCHPYIWIHDSVGDFTRMVKQQYISLEDLRDCSEIRIFRDHQRGCISVRKKPRPDFC